MKNFENINKIFGVQRSAVFKPKERFEIYEHSKEEPRKVNLVQRRKPKQRIHFFSSCNFKEGRWDHEEHRLFVKSCLLHGNNWRKVQKEIKTRSSAQIRSHAQKYVIRLCRKYSIAVNKKTYLNGLKFPKFTHMKISSKTFSEINEEDKKILEIFKIIDKNTNFEFIPQQEVKSDDCSISLFSQSVVKESTPIKILKKQKKPIFRIFKTNQSPNFINTKKFIAQLEQMTYYNTKILLDLLGEEKVETNLKNISDFISYNIKYNTNSFMEKEVKIFEDIMNKSLSRWKVESTTTEN